MGGSLSGYSKKPLSLSGVSGELWQQRNSSPKLGQALFSLTALCKCQVSPHISLGRAECSCPGGLWSCHGLAGEPGQSASPSLHRDKKVLPVLKGGISDAELLGSSCSGFCHQHTTQEILPVLHPFPWSSAEGFPANPEAVDTTNLGITALL